MSKDGKTWGTENLCVENNPDGTSESIITYTIGTGDQKRVVAKYFLNSGPSGSGISYVISPTASSVWDPMVEMNIDDVNNTLSFNGTELFLKPL